MARKPIKVAILNIHQGINERGAEAVIESLAKMGEDFLVEVFSIRDLKNIPHYVKLKLKINSKTQDISIQGKRPYVLRRIYLDYWSLKILSYTLKSIPRILKHRYEIVICFNRGWQPFIVRLVTLMYGGKMVITGASGIGWDDRISLLSFPNLFISPSKKAAKWAKKINPLVSSVYIPNGVNYDDFASGVASYKTKLRRPIVLCVGALTKSKRIDLTIRAVSKLENASLIIAGKGEEEENLRKLCEKYLSGRFEIISLPQAQMPMLYKAADLFTLTPVTREAFGIVFLEAMASNLPVVTINDEIRRDIVNKAGIYVDDPTDTKEYSEKLKQALSVNWGDSPKNIVRNNYQWDSVVKIFEKELKKII